MGREKLLSLTLCVMALGSIVVVSARIYHLKSMGTPTKPAVQVAFDWAALKRDTVIAGSAASPYSLIEFMDYQCPPCRAEWEDVQAFMKANGDRANYDARMLPLSFHEHAKGAAIAAMLARAEGKLSEVHGRLFTTADLSVANCKKICLEAGVSEKNWNAKAKAVGAKQLDADLKLADDLRVDATPTFFLVTPKHAVYRLTNLGQAKALIDAGR